MQKHDQGQLRSANLSASGTFIAGYHFTSRAALVGDGGSVAAATPGSVLVAGILPAKSDDYDPVLRSPLPPCVWLTSDPDMPDDFCTRHGVRISVVIPSTDRRLVHWPKYIRKHDAGIVETQCRAPYTPAFAQRAAAQFYVYFGPVALDRIRKVDGVAACKLVQAA
jgi:hypothetical protein